MFCQVVHKFCHPFFRRLFKFGKINRVVFDNVYQVGRYLAVDLYQLVRVFYAVVKIVKQDVLQCNLIFCFPVKMISASVNAFRLLVSLIGMISFRF